MNGHFYYPPKGYKESLNTQQMGNIIIFRVNQAVISVFFRIRTITLPIQLTNFLILQSRTLLTSLPVF